MKRIFSVMVGVAGLAMFVGTADAQDAQAQKGMQVFVAQKCNVCHSIAGKGKKSGPLDDVGDKLSAAEIRSVDHRSRQHGRQIESSVEAQAADEEEAAVSRRVDSLVALLAGLKKM